VPWSGIADAPKAIEIVGGATTVMPALAALPTNAPPKAVIGEVESVLAPAAMRSR